MTLEQSLAAQKIAAMKNQGYGKEAAAQAAMKLLKSQGFGAAHSDYIARNITEELYIN